MRGCGGREVCVKEEEVCVECERVWREVCVEGGSVWRGRCVEMFGRFW